MPLILVYGGAESGKNPKDYFYYTRTDPAPGGETGRPEIAPISPRERREETAPRQNRLRDWGWAALLLSGAVGAGILNARKRR